MINKAIILYCLQLYKALLPLAFIPLIINVLGTERYGIIAFFYMLVGLLGLLDAGISGTFLKLVATNKGDIKNYRKVFVLFIKILFVFILIGFSLFIFFNLKEEYVVSTWINTKVARKEALYAVQSIGLILFLLYVKSYLSSFVNGMEKQELVSIWGGVYNTIFYFGSYISIRYIDGSLFSFFYIMKWLAILDVLVVIIMVFLIYTGHVRILLASDLIHDKDVPELIGNEFKLTKIIKFSIQLSGLSIIWVIATQIDRFVLSMYIPLDEYAKYQIAVQLSSTIAVISAPLTQILLPKLSNLYHDNQHQLYTKLFCNSLVIFTFLLAPLGPYFFYFGGDLISLWIGDAELAYEVNNFSKWLVSAAFVSAIMNFIFIYLYSVGHLKQHFYAYALYSLFSVPLSILVAKHYGAIGSAKFVFAHTLIFMLIWGGWQLKSKFIGLAYQYLIMLISVLVISNVCFYVFFDILGKYNTIIKVFSPPFINFFLMLLIAIVFKEKVLIMVRNVKLKSS